MIIYDVFNDNNIGASGGSVIGEGLKFNSTLKELDLSMWVLNQMPFENSFCKS